MLTEAERIKHRQCDARRYLLHKDALLERKRERYRNNREKILLANRLWRQTHKEKVNTCVRNWSAKNRTASRRIKSKYDNSEKGMKKRRERERIGVKSLSDGYMKNLIRKRNSLDARYIPSELVEVKRLLIQARRIIHDNV